MLDTAQIQNIHQEMLTEKISKMFEDLNKQKTTENKDVLCATGILTASLILSMGTHNEYDKQKISALVGLPNGCVGTMVESFQGHINNDPQSGFFGTVILITPIVKLTFKNQVASLLDNIHHMIHYDKAVADQIVSQSTRGIIEEAFSGNMPTGLLNMVLILINVFSGEWAQKRRGLDSFYFNGMETTGIRFMHVATVVNNSVFKACAIRFKAQNGRGVWGFFIENKISPPILPLHNIMQVVLSQNGNKFHVEVPEFRAQTDLDLKEQYLGNISLPLVADSAELGLLKQKTQIECNRNGAIAAAVTSAVVVTRGGGGSTNVDDTPVIRFDNKFTFAIAHLSPKVGIVVEYLANIA